MTIKDLIHEIVQITASGDTRSPHFWVDKAILIVSLWPELKDDLAKAEMKYKAEIADLLEEGMAVSKAEYVVKGMSESYHQYLTLRARDEVIDNLIKLCKIRARTESPEQMNI